MRQQESLPVLNRTVIEELQLKKLNRLLRREKARGGFYRDLPESLTSLSQMQELPFTTAQDLSEEGYQMVLLSQSKISRVRTEETSGTAGPVKRMYYSDYDNLRTVSFFTAGLSELVDPGDLVMICMPYSGDRGLGELISEAILRLDAVPLAVGIGKTYGELRTVLERERPNVFVGMPVPLLSILRLNPGCSLRRALVSADACPQSAMSEIEARLGSKLFPHYGSREIGLGGAVTCAAHEGVHLRENDVIAEIVDEEGAVLPWGCWGELVVTSIGLEAMPLIRYRTGDRTRIFAEPCPCGSSILRLDRVTRLRKASPDIAELDQLLFSEIPQLVDYRAAWQNGKLFIRGYTCNAQQSELPKQAGGYPLAFALKQVSEADAPCYPAKRRIYQNPT